MKYSCTLSRALMQIWLPSDQSPVRHEQKIPTRPTKKIWQLLAYILCQGPISSTLCISFGRKRSPNVDVKFEINVDQAPWKKYGGGERRPNSRHHGFPTHLQNLLFSQMMAQASSLSASTPRPPCLLDKSPPTNSTSSRMQPRNRKRLIADWPTWAASLRDLGPISPMLCVFLDRWGSRTCS